MPVAGEQLGLNSGNLRINHSKQVEFTTTCERQVLRCIGKYFGMRGVLQRAH